MEVQEQVRAGPAMNISQADCRAIFDAMSDAVLIHEVTTGEILEVNRGMCQMFGYTPEEARQLKVTALCGGGPGSQLEPALSLLAKAAAGSPQVFEWQARDRAGRVFWVEVHLKPIRLGGRDHVLAVLRDIDRRKQAEEALQTQTRVLESMAEGVTVTDADGKIMYSNPAFDTMFGYQPGELIGQSASRLNDFSAAEGLRFAEEMVEQLKTKRILSGEVRNRRKDGTSFYTQARISALEIAGERCWVTVQEDISERRQVEAALRQSEASYRIVTEGSLAGVYLIQDGKFRYVNPMLAQAFGYTPDEVIDRLGPADLLDPEDRSRILEVVERRLAGEGMPSRSNFKALGKDGSVIYVETLSRQVEYQGRPAVMGTFLNVTERQLAEEALKASEEKYRTIFGAVNDGIVVIDPETGHFLEVNQKYLEMAGYDQGEAATLSLEKVCSAEAPFTVQDALELKRKALEEGPQLFEWWAEDRRGRRFWIEINLALTPVGGRDRLLAVIRDISERKQAEDIRRRAYEELEQVVAARTAGLQSANAQLRREIEERRHTEEIIRLQRDLALTLGGKAQLQEALRLCVETAITISGLDSGGLYLVDPASGDLDLAYHQGFSPEFVRRGAYYEADDLNTYLVMAGRPVYARLQDLPGLMDEEGLKEGLRSVAIIPVIHQDRVIASIHVASYQHEEVPATARAALETLASQVGSAIARVQAEEDLRQAKEDLEIRVAARTAQLRQANESLEAELRVRRDMEKSLRFSETQYRTLVEQIPAITYTISLAAGVDFLYVSPQVEPLLGFSPEAWRSDTENWERQIHPDDRERLLAEITQSLETGEPFSTEYRLLAKSGRVVWFRDEARVVYDPEGQFLFLQGLALDITERKRAEEELRRQAELLDLAHDAIIVRDLDNRIVFWNSGAEETYGWAKAEVQGQETYQLLGTEFSQPREELEAELFRQGQWQGELSHTRQDGRRIVVTSRWALQRDKKGKPAAILEINRDITGQKQAEAGRERLAAILEATSDLVSTADQKGRILYLNRAGRKMLGIGVDEDITGLIVKDFHPEWAWNLIREGSRQAAMHHRVWSGETTFRSRNGEEIPTSQVLIAHRSVADQVEFFSTIARDITASRRAAEALQEANNRLRTLVQASPLAIIAVDLKGRVISWNPAAERMFGWRQEEVLGRPLPTIPPGQKEALQALHQQRLEGANLLGQELRRQRRDGSRIDVRISNASLHDGAGAMTGFMGIIEDITEPKRMAATLRQASRALKAITECHQALIRATDETELLGEVCRIIVEAGGYRMAWVGYAEADAHKSVRPVAQHGFDAGYVEQLNLTWADKERGRGPVGAAIRTGKLAISQDTRVDPGVAFMRAEALKRGYASILALPLQEAHTFGVLTIYAADPNAFDHEEINLLLGLANDLAYGIMALRGRAEQRRAEEALKESEQELRRLASQLLSIQEKERRRVARELHDELGQALTVLKINLVAIEDKLAPDQEHLKASCEHNLAYIDTVIENVRRLSWDLSPSSLEDLGLSAALGYLVDETCRNHNIQCTVEMDEIDHLFTPEIQINIYRIFQESLTNVVKHARASLVSVKVAREDGKVSFTIRDNGRGFNLKQAMSGKVAKKSLGLTAMHERALMARGSLQISSRKGRGTTIAFFIPTTKRGK